MGKQKLSDVNDLADKFIRKNLLNKFCTTSETTQKTDDKKVESDDVETTMGNSDDEDVEENLTPESDDVEETVEEPKPVVVVKEIDQVALANTNQIMEIFSVA